MKGECWTRELMEEWRNFDVKFRDVTGGRSRSLFPQFCQIQTCRGGVGTVSVRVNFRLWTVAVFLRCDPAPRELPTAA